MPRQVVCWLGPARRPAGSLRMEHGNGVAAVAAARAFGHARRGRAAGQSGTGGSSAARSSAVRRAHVSKPRLRTSFRPCRLLFCRRVAFEVWRSSRPRTPGSGSCASRRPMSSLTKPSTLIETPIEWNGDGLLPGESISRYRGSAARPRLLPAVKRSTSDELAGSSGQPAGSIAAIEHLQRPEWRCPKLRPMKQ